ncbi:DNA gyrase inhibitor YacG [Rhodoplanes serenus]|uniref:DNA gyrase inhibitor YacG n=1 Tax=Rhodoplanes serenus TaxID=200615 RepID=A0A3S4B3S7_9BRAD|nr:DNA gyrase inhibitor YacG [Rhodoplanes serenus]VCU08417.1 DNA gyrase inhibitor YacG [Rhodoplanes serenus]
MSSLAPGRPCPICRKPAAEPHRPFCSQRCKDVDLHRWLSGVYAVPAVEAEEDELGLAEPEDAPPLGRRSPADGT